MRVLVFHTRNSRYEWYEDGRMVRFSVHEMQTQGEPVKPQNPREPQEFGTADRVKLFLPDGQVNASFSQAFETSFEGIRGAYFRIEDDRALTPTTTKEAHKLEDSAEIEADREKWFQSKEQAI